MHTLTVYPSGKTISAEHGDNLLAVLGKHGMSPSSPCGGQGICEKCKVHVLRGGWEEEVLACQTTITSDMVIRVAESCPMQVMTDAERTAWDFNPAITGKIFAAIDIGTTTVAEYLIDGQNGYLIDKNGLENPQKIFGADVVSRINCAVKEQKAEKLAATVRNSIAESLKAMASRHHIDWNQIDVISIVGNPCMEQIFLGLPLDNLIRPPFPSILKKSEIRSATPYLGIDAKLLIAPTLSGYVGGDTIGCIVASDMDRSSECTLLIDIGTNGEMVLGNKNKLIACSTAAGPALEGANISCGTSARPGAIDHVWIQNGEIHYSTIEGTEAIGICGSGIIDAMAVMLEAGIINKRGRICDAGKAPENVRDRLITIQGERAFLLDGSQASCSVYITQEDVRQFQLAKGAIAAGICLLMKEVGVSAEEIDHVLLAGAFGSYIKPQSACRTGMIPDELLDKIRAVGNIAGSGARKMVSVKGTFEHEEELAEQVVYLNISEEADFQHVFGKNMYF